MQKVKAATSAMPIPEMINQILIPMISASGPPKARPNGMVTELIAINVENALPSLSSGTVS